MHDRGPPSGTLTKTFCELERSGLMRLPEACLLVALLENTKESLSHHLTATLSLEVSRPLVLTLSSFRVTHSVQQSN